MRSSSFASATGANFAAELADRFEERLAVAIDGLSITIGGQWLIAGAGTHAILA